MKQPIGILGVLLCWWCLWTTPLFAQSDAMTTVTVGPFSALPTVAIAGRQISFLVKITNTGAVDARQPLVTQNLFSPFPSGAHVVDLSIVPGSSNFGYVATGGECTDSGVCQLPTLPPDGVLTLQATIAVDADQGGDGADSASIEVRSCLRAVNAAQACATFRLPILRSADLQLRQSALTPSLAPGTPALIRIEVENAGPSHVVAPGASFGITNQIDGVAGISISAVSGSDCSITGATTFTCDDLQLAAGDRRTIFVTVQTPTTVPTQSTFTSCATLSALHGVTDPATANNGPSCTAVQLVDQGANLRLTRFVEPSNFVRAGERFTVTTLVDNLGPNPAQTLTLTETIQAGGRFTVLAIDDNDQATCTAPPLAPQPGLTTRCTLTGSLAAGALWTVKTFATATTDMEIYSRALVRSASPVDPNLDNNVDDTVIQIGNVADLDLRVTTALRTTLYPTDHFSYTLSIANGGPSVATNVLIRTYLPTGFSVRALPAFCAVATTNGEATITCRFSQLAVGVVERFFIELGVGENAPAGLQSLPVESNSDVYDNNPANNHQHLTAALADLADVQTVLTVSQRAPVVGDTINLALAITNHGPALAQAVVVTPTLPPGLTWVATDPACHPIRGCALGDLAAGQQARLTLTVAVARSISCATAHPITAAVHTTTYDPNQQNNRTQVNLAPTCQVDLRVLSLTPGPATLPVGTPFTHTFIVDNLGPGYAHDVVFEAVLSAAADFTIVHVQPSVDATQRAAHCTLPPAAVTDAADRLDPWPVTGNRLTVQCRLTQSLEPAVQADESPAPRAAVAGAAPTAGAGRWLIALRMITTEPRQINSVADVSSSDEERNLNDNVAQAQQAVQCNTGRTVDLDLQVQAKGSGLDGGLPTVVTGATVTFTMAATNYSRDAVVCAQLVTQVPQHTRFHAAGSTPGWSCTDHAPSGTSCTYALVASPGGQAQTLDFAVTVDPLITNGLVTTHVTQLEDNGVDNNQTNNRRETAFLIVMPARYWLPLITR
ncbi:MAG: DUF11 domain-containing protein [Caldilineaceae bacterium]|nr:DUF11 domain-containing protein [Caldilineaceae bacterium]